MNTPPRCAVVTGASSGIGEAVALQLAARGRPVIALARRTPLLDALHARDPRITPMAIDLRDGPAVDALFARIAEEHGPVEILVNSAGIGFGASLLEGSRPEWEAILDVNVLALAHCTQLAVAQMRAHGDHGTVVHVSSMSGHRAVTWSGMYAASKFAVRALAEALRLELREVGSAVRVASVSPGSVATRFNLQPGEPDKQRDFEMLTAADVTAAVLHVIDAPPHVDVTDILLRPTGQPR